MPPRSAETFTSDPVSERAAACEALMRGGSKTFFAASRVLPKRVRAPATALYAFCRIADDEIDLGHDKAQALARLHERLDAIYAGTPAPHAADRAFSDVVRDFRIPRALPAALLDGFAWDADNRCYATLADLEAYGARVAGTVGAMMALIMGARDAQTLSRACELGVAMQLTNIARDVGEDALAGRLYLPLDWLREEGIDPQAWLSAPAFTPALGRVVARLLASADALYRRAGAGVAALPFDCRAAIAAAGRIYAEIGREVERAGLDSVSRRAVVGPSRKRGLLLRAVASSLVVGLGARSDASPLAAIRYLVDAAAEAPARQRLAGIDARVESLAGIFTRLAERDRLTMVHGRAVETVAVR
jgi:phytoene synthase